MISKHIQFVIGIDRSQLGYIQIFLRGGVLQLGTVVEEAGKYGG